MVVEGKPFQGLGLKGTWSKVTYYDGTSVTSVPESGMIHRCIGEYLVRELSRGLHVSHTEKRSRVPIMTAVIRTVGWTLNEPLKNPRFRLK